MALLFVDGFDHYATADITKKWNSTSGATIDPTGGRRGGGAFKSLAAGAATKAIPPSPTVVIGWAWKVGDLGGTLLTLYNAGQVHDRLMVLGTGQMQAQLADGMVHATSTNSVAAGNWYYMEFKIFIHDTAGTIELRVNGAPWFALTGRDTRYATYGAAVDGFMITGGNGIAWVDDLYVLDTTGTSNNDFLGDQRVDTLYPTADGTYSQFTPSTGTTHYTLVDETAPNTTDYVDGTAAGQRDSYQFSDLTALAVQNIAGVQVNAAILKDDAGARSVCTFARSSTTDGDGASVALSTSQLYVSQVYPTNPNGGAAWSESAVNAAEFGVKVTA